MPGTTAAPRAAGCASSTATTRRAWSSAAPVSSTASPRTPARRTPGRDVRPTPEQSIRPTTRVTAPASRADAFLADEELRFGIRQDDVPRRATRQDAFMTSDRLRPPPSGPPLLRPYLAPESALPRRIEGAWWPRTSDLPTELPQPLSGLPRQGPNPQCPGERHGVDRSACPYARDQVVRVRGATTAHASSTVVLMAPSTDAGPFGRVTGGSRVTGGDRADRRIACVRHRSGGGTAQLRELSAARAAGSGQRGKLSRRTHISVPVDVWVVARLRSEAATAATPAGRRASPPVAMSLSMREPPSRPRAACLP
ncbi:DUF5994 family protein [Streptomyces anandii]|uniref:DUF5994 family protein n=1 Tax=Streptomyces anandii TaxID=285454 RepID=UPI00379CCA9B